MKTFQKPLKERVSETLKIFQEQYPDLDICVVGSMSMYLQDIEYKYPHDIDIVILNNEMSDNEFEEFGKKIYLMCWRTTGLRIDLVTNIGDVDYNIIDLYGLKIKCNTPNHNKAYLAKFGIGKDQKYKVELERLTHILDGKEDS